MASRLVSSPPTSSVQRSPADFATADALAIKAPWGFMLVGGTPWGDLLTAIKAYAALGDAQVDQREAQLDRMPALIRAWENRYLIGADPDADTLKNISALAQLRALIRREENELGSLGAYDRKVDEATQTLTAVRFKGDHMLEQAALGVLTIARGDRGLFVRKIQQALSDADRLDRDQVTGVYDAHTELAVRLVQQAAGLTQTGRVDQATMQALNAAFVGYGVERTLATGPAVGAKALPGAFPWGAAPAELTAETQNLDPAEKAAAAKTITTAQVASAGGALPTFRKVTANGDYETRLFDMVARLAENQYKSMGKGKAGKRKDSDLYGWDLVDAIAAESKAVTDAVFGKYNTGPPLSHGVGLFDAWEDKVAKLTDPLEPTAADDAAKWRVTKLLTGHAQVQTLDIEHGAIQDRPAEKAIVDRVRDRVVAAKRAKLIETHKGWPAYAGGGQVYLQRFKAGDAVNDRNGLWRLFHTVVHEYLHTLEHPRHIQYRTKLREQKGGKTLREGVVEYFTHTVLAAVTYTPDLRRIVEGAFNDPTTDHPIPAYGGYRERINAEKLAGIVGARNVMAAFFLGDVAKIGGAVK